MARSVDVDQLVERALARRPPLGRPADLARRGRRPAAARGDGGAGAARPGAPTSSGSPGSPGVGKSTTTSALVAAFRAAGRRVGVLAVDPSSPFSGGALLGDRIRMQEHATDPEVFIRSMASRGHLGGLASATPQAVRVLDAAGCDVVLVETVGRRAVRGGGRRRGRHHDGAAGPRDGRRHPGGQGRHPGGRRRLRGEQGRPRGRRLDRPRAAAHDRPRPSGQAGAWKPPVLKVIATRGEGLPELVAAIDGAPAVAGVLRDRGDPASHAALAPRSRGSPWPRCRPGSPGSAATVPSTGWPTTSPPGAPTRSPRPTASWPRSPAERPPAGATRRPRDEYRDLHEQRRRSCALGGGLRRRRWQSGKVRDADFTTLSGDEVEPVYGPPDGGRARWRRSAGRASSRSPAACTPPATAGRLWTIRQFAGFGNAEQTNGRFRDILAAGGGGLSVAFDMPTLMGRDSDDPLALGEVGHCGVAIDSAARHGGPVRRHPARRRHDLDDDQRPGRARSSRCTSWPPSARARTSAASTAPCRPTSSRSTSPRRSGSSRPSRTCA